MELLLKIVKDIFRCSHPYNCGRLPRPYVPFLICTCMTPVWAVPTAPTVPLPPFVCFWIKKWIRIFFLVEVVCLDASFAV